MSLLFLIPVAIFLIAAYVFKNSTDEMAYLAATISLVSLVISLFIAPWQIQLLLLMLVLFSNLGQRRPSNQAVESHEQEKSTLLYRGANYELPPVQLEGTSMEITGKYRGRVWRSHDVVNVPSEAQSFNLKYRGVSVTNQKALVPVVQEPQHDDMNHSSESKAKMLLHAH
ncbi:MAG TPA: DUF4278 domain-containing protein [Coleofasciculaceae cyanobacterium]